MDKSNYKGGLFIICLGFGKNTQNYENRSLKLNFTNFKRFFHRKTILTLYPQKETKYHKSKEGLLCSAWAFLNLS